MGNTSGLLNECIEELGHSGELVEEAIEEIIEPLAREGLVSEISTGIATVITI